VSRRHAVLAHGCPRRVVASCLVPCDQCRTPPPLVRWDPGMHLAREARRLTVSGDIKGVVGRPIGAIGRRRGHPRE